MQKSHSLKADNKPTLFSFDIESVNKNIDTWVFDNQQYSKRDLEKEAKMLRQIAIDFIEIIETKVVKTSQLDNLTNAIINGARGVWESATSKLELLAFHFDEAKQTIQTLLSQTNSKILEKSLSCVSDAFTTDEQIEIFSKTFQAKSKKIRIKTAETALDLRNQNLVNFLKIELHNQADEEVKETIEFAIDNMWQEKGRLTFNVK